MDRPDPEEEAIDDLKGILAAMKKEMAYMREGMEKVGKEVATTRYNDALFNHRSMPCM